MTPSEYEKYFDDVLINLARVWGSNGEIGPNLCCVNTGFMHIITASDKCAVITQRTGDQEPTHQGYLTTDVIEINNIHRYFDNVFCFNYFDQATEMQKLRQFILEVRNNDFNC